MSKLVQLVLRLDERAIAHFDKRRKTARTDGVAGQQIQRIASPGAQRNRANRALRSNRRIDRQGVEALCLIKLQLHGLPVKQRHARIGEDGNAAIIAGENLNIDLARQHVDAAVALVQQVGRHGGITRHGQNAGIDLLDAL